MSDALLPRIHPVDRALIEQAKRAGAEFVTFDSCMPGGGHDAVRRVMEEIERESQDPDISYAAARPDDPELIPLDREMISALAAASHKTSEIHVAIARRLMTLPRAARVRHLRVELHASWRYIAQNCFDQWGHSNRADWDPPHNQLMGMALCEMAAAWFNEDYMKSPWN